MWYVIIILYIFIIEWYLRKYFFGLKLNCLYNILYIRFFILIEEFCDLENFIIVILNISLIRSEMDFKIKFICCLFELFWNVCNS